MLTKSQRVTARVGLLRRASAPHVRVSFRSAAKRHDSGSEHLRAFALMRHDRGAAESLRQRRARTAPGSSAR